MVSAVGHFDLGWVNLACVGAETLARRGLIGKDGQSSLI